MANGADAGYLSASLNFMAADTRKGLSGKAREDFAAIKDRAAPHVSEYVEKIERSLQNTPR